MAILSVLKYGTSVLKTTLSKNNNANIVRQMSGHGPSQMNITPSRWQWHKFKDYFHFYTMLGVIPLSALTLYVNIFIGPAKLTPIPEGYVPEEYEFHSHPISRFLAKYVAHSHQKDFETYLNVIHIADEKRKMKLIEKKVNELINERLDSKAYYYDPVLTKYHRRVRQDHKDAEYAAGI